jgi:hypothetical protein
VAETKRSGAVSTRRWRRLVIDTIDVRVIMGSANGTIPSELKVPHVLVFVPNETYLLTVAAAGV